VLSVFFFKTAAMASSFDEITSNLKAHVLTYVTLFLISLVEISPVVLPKGPRYTDTQTHKHTQTPPGFPPNTSTIHLVNEMTKCKNGRIIVNEIFCRFFYIKQFLKFLQRSTSSAFVNYTD